MSSRSKMQHRMRTTAVALTLALSLSACGLGDSDEPKATPSESEESSASASESPSESPSSSTTEIPPAETGALDREASVEFPEEKVKLVRATSELALTVSDEAVIAHEGGDPEALYELPAEEGTIWTDLQVDEESGIGVATQLTLRPGVGTVLGDAQGTAVRFDLETGEETGRAQMKLPYPTEGALHVELRTTAPTVAVVETWIDGGPRRITAFDLDSGKRLWVKPNLAFVAADDRVAVFSTGNAFAPGGLVALKLANGKPAWRGYRGAMDVRPVGVDGRVLTLAGTDDRHAGPVLTQIDLRKGRLRGKQRKVPHNAWVCPADPDEKVTVCQVNDGNGLAAVDLSRGRLLWSLPKGDRVAPTLSLVQDGLVYAFLLDGRSLILDARTGKDVPGDAGMAPVAVTDDGGYLAFIGKVTFMPWLDR